MKSFLQHFGSLVLGILHGFDRLRFRGSKRLLCNPRASAYFYNDWADCAGWRPAA